MTTKTVKNYKIIDLKHYTKEKSKFTFDFGDFWFDTPRLTSLKELDQHSFPDTKFPPSFTEEDKLDCINDAYMRAEEQSYMDDYIAKFHDKLLDNLNDLTDKVRFEYEENYMDSIKLKVYYGIEFITAGVTDDDGTPYDVEDWLGNGFVDFDEAVEKTRSYMESYHAYDGDVFDDVYKESIKEKIAEIKAEKLTTYQKVKNMMDRHISKRKRVYNIIKIVQNGR